MKSSTRILLRTFVVCLIIAIAPKVANAAGEYFEAQMESKIEQLFDIG